MPDVYEPNPKHKHPWQPGAKGTLCPRDVDGVALFRTSVTDPSRPGKRYNTDGRQAYCAHPNTNDRPRTPWWYGTDTPSNGERCRCRCNDTG